MKKELVIKIDESIIKTAVECEKDCVCLSSTSHNLCAVTHSVHDKIVFIECMNNEQCIYRNSFGFNSYICHCPVRNEIYRKYKT